MTTIVTRSDKGSMLTWAEMDANLTNLNNDKLEVGSPASSIAITPVGELTSTNVQDALSELDSEVTNKVVQTSTTGAAVIPTGSTAQRPSTPIEGHFRRNKELGQWEGYDGSNWTGFGGVTSVNGQTGAVTLVKGDVGLGNVDNTADSAKSVDNATKLGGVAAASYALIANAETDHTHSGYVSTNMSHGEVGSLCFAGRGADTPYVPGATVAGSSLRPASVTGTTGGANAVQTYGTALSGTWRCLGYCPNLNTNSVYNTTLWQRIS